MTLGRFGKKDAGTAAASFVRVDSLQMAYNGNQLTRVTDKGVTVAIAESEDFKDYANGSGQYTYNKNGALIKDTHKGILGISYNSLNLPRELAVKNSSVSGKNYYTYSASGVKLKTVHMGSTNLNYVPVFGSNSGDSNFNEVTTTEYIGNKVYENNVLKKILVEGGYYDVEKGKYFFYVQDHLGNNRLVADENGTVTQATHYYPFGQGFANSEGQSEQPYKYNGKEQDRRHGLNMYDYSARQMEPAIGRFTTVDPLAEDYYNWSPYAYVMNNPLRFTDPTGMAPSDTINVYLPAVEIEGKEIQKTKTLAPLAYNLSLRNMDTSKDVHEFGISHLPMPGPGSIKSLWQAIKNIPSAVKNIGSVFKSAKNAGGFSRAFLSTLSRTISTQKQARHVSGSAPTGKGYLNSQADAQKILDAVHTGEATYLGTSSQGHIIVRYTGVTGTNVNLGANISSQPTNVFMIKGTASPSVVPTNPNWVAP